ncbi:MAG: trypsin-like peptidase domain-containing protein [Microcoleus sp.]
MLQNRWRNWGLAFIGIITSLVLVITASAFRSNASPSLASNSLEQVHPSTLVAQATNQPEFDAVNSIARATTVFIGQGIENSKDVEVKGKIAAGSGVIIARRNSTYYVLTNSHVVEPFINKYGIRTHDGEVHLVDNRKRPQYAGRPDSTEGLIYRFTPLDLNRNVYDGYDLAVLQFDSSKEYPVAVIGDSSTIKPGERIYVSGWPSPKDYTSEDRKRVQRNGELKQILNPSDPNGNYSLCYSAETAAGMSGGPVFNSKGEVIGIHGQAKNSRQGCIDSSLGIKIDDFIKEQEKIERYRLTSAFKRPPANPSEFSRMVRNRNADIFTAAEYLRFFDVSPNDPSFSAILSMVDKYGCMRAYEDGSFRPLDSQTRGEFAIDIRTCLDKIVEKFAVGGSGISRKDFESTKKTVLNLFQVIKSLKNTSPSNSDRQENFPR